jgi:WD40 repeat protein
VKRLLFRLLGAGTLAAALAVGVSIISLQPSDAPFLYYYSWERSAFIISRADSSDGRVLARYSVPNELTHIRGPGWSQSAKWFAWTGHPVNGPGYDMNVYVVRREGDEPTTLLESPGLIRLLVWSPNSDLLLVSYYPSVEIISENVFVYDPENQEFIVQIIGADIREEIRYHTAGWSPDGQYVALFDGRNIRLVPMDRSQQYLIGSRTFGIDNCGEFGVLPQFLSEGRMIYRHPDETAIVLEDLDTHKQIVIEIPEGVIRSVDWSPDNRYALVYVQRSQEEFKYDLWLLSIPEKTFELLTNDVWFINCLPFDESAWNTENQAVFATADGQLRLLITTTPNYVVDVPAPMDGNLQIGAPIRWIPDGSVMFAWYVRALYGAQIYIYSPISGESDLIVPDDRSKVIVAEYFAPLRGDYLAYQGGIVNVATGISSDLRFQTSRFTGSFGIEELYWHPTEDWLFLAGSNIENLHPINVVRMDGVIQRELALCPLQSISCFGWLPDVRDLDGSA